MPFLNLNYNLLVYEDQNNPKNPDIRLPDFHKNIEGVVVDFDKSDRFVVYQNETKDIITTQRPVTWDLTTELEFTKPFNQQSLTRLQYTGTGTAPNFRTNRSINGASDTIVSISRVNNYVVRVQNVGGTVWSLTNVQNGDFLRIEASNDLGFTSPFAAQNQGKELFVQAKGSDYIDVVDNGVVAEDPNVTLGSDFDKVLKVLSLGPVKKYDLIQISSDGGVNPSNAGKFEVQDVTDTYIEYTNPLSVNETFTYSAEVVVYEYLIGFLNLRSSGPIQIRFDNQQEWISLGRLGTEAVFVGSVSAHRIQARNINPDTVSLSIQNAMVLKS